MKFNITPGMIIFMLGFGGLVLSLAEGPKEIGSKVPLALFFLFIIGFGVVVEIKSKDNLDEFGEMESRGGFG
jgi:hypothetical protein